jgi:hypothetical protein
MDKPFETVMAMLTAGSLGLDDISGSIPGLTKDFTSNMGDMFDFPVDSIHSILPVNTVESFF